MRDYRIFFIDNSIVSISGMTITNGKSPDGAAGTGQFGGPGGGIRQVVVKLPDNVLGLPRDLFVKVTLRGPSSNRGRIRIATP